MSRAIIGDQEWAEMSEARKVDAVLKGQATLKQMSEGLLDGSEKLRSACQQLLARTESSFDNLPIDTESHAESAEPPDALRKKNLRNRRVPKAKTRVSATTFKQRFGLPKGFVPRLQRYGHSVLLELNIYRLPNGQEFIPCHPTGTLGTRHHLYALLTGEQYSKAKRGSLYVRTDGRIFDYSVVSTNPARDLFDTGYTIHDLERTGRYAPVARRNQDTEQPKYRRAAAAG